MTDYFLFGDAPHYRRAAIDHLVGVVRGPQGAQRLLEYQDRVLEMHDRIADAVGDPAAGYWIGSEARAIGVLTEFDESNPLSELFAQNVREVLVPVLEASRDVRWTVLSFQADGSVETYDLAEKRSGPRGIAQFRLPTPTYRRLWATAVGRGALNEIRQELGLSWAIFEQEIGPPPAETIEAAKNRLREMGSR